METDHGNHRPSPKKKPTATATITTANKGDEGTKKTEVANTLPNPTARQHPSIPQHSEKVAETPATTPDMSLEGLQSDNSKTQVQEIKKNRSSTDGLDRRGREADTGTTAAG
ncbi:hypothetical protein CVT24_006851 [Panaeolus cyanescens]|uniref:Uncharacterized protein n=1 Tax=Panaeolus cyanescens TaxID=181874 RepID=A0A409YS27_9AGAR|nr:hypothetical protein CVT24_006851 [Panaeolus cyanescens]